MNNLPLPIHSLDYTVIFARQWQAMREFYEHTLSFPVHRELGPWWVEFLVGSDRLALVEQGLVFHGPAQPAAALSKQLGFRVAPSEVDKCAAILKERGVKLTSEPTDQPWGRRTLFFRDPDFNVLEIYADI